MRIKIINGRCCGGAHPDCQNGQSHEPYIFMTSSTTKHHVKIWSTMIHRSLYRLSSSANGSISFSAIVNKKLSTISMATNPCTKPFM